MNEPRENIDLPPAWTDPREHRLEGVSDRPRQIHLGSWENCGPSARTDTPRRRMTE